MYQCKLFLLIFLFLGFFSRATAQTTVTLSGSVRNKLDKKALPFVNIVLRSSRDSAFVTGSVSGEVGRFTLSGILPGNYLLQVSCAGFKTITTPLFAGSLSSFLELPVIEMEEDTRLMENVTLSTGQESVSARLDKKTFSLSDLVSQGGGSVLQVMQSLPGVTILEGKLQLRGSDKVTILVDGKQTALTGFGSQSGLDNIPASAIEKIEIINNPSAKYDANGDAGIINILMKKSRQEGLNGKIGLATGAGALWLRQENLPTIRPQYQRTPKINPTLSFNYRKKKLNLFGQADDLYTHTLNKNEFVTRVYDDGTIIHSQLKRNRNTNFLTTKTGIDWFIDPSNTFTVSGLYGSEKIIDRGDQPFFNADKTQRLRLWQFLEDELKTTVMGTALYQHKFRQPGHVLNTGFNYTFHREDEKYFYDNYLPASSGTDAFKLISDEQVYDFNADYSRPQRYGRLEAGIRLRNRIIPTNMQFVPGRNSVLDSTAGGKATYKELIPAIYGNYIFETKRWEAELGLRMEYVRIRYEVNPGHNTYKTDGYHYTQPFPNFRLAFKINERNKLTVFYNRRVDRPNEVDIRIFPKYDDAEIIKVGNPALRPQFTQSVEAGFKTSWANGSLYAALYHRFSHGSITRISTIVPGSTLVYALFQNAGKSYNSGMELTWEHRLSPRYTCNINGNLYRNQINAFSVENKYPRPHIFSAAKQKTISGSLKMNNNFRFVKGFDAQLVVVYLAPDIIPQGKISSRFSLDGGMKKTVQKGKGELIFNVTDLFNTLVIRKKIEGNGFRYTSDDYYETQVVRLGYNFKF